MSQGTPRSVNRGHLTSVFSGQPPSVLTCRESSTFRADAAPAIARASGAASETGGTASKSTAPRFGILAGTALFLRKKTGIDDQGDAPLASLVGRGWRVY
jgi:hypothetical protein